MFLDRIIHDYIDVFFWGGSRIKIKLKKLCVFSYFIYKKRPSFISSNLLINALFAIFSSRSRSISLNSLDFAWLSFTFPIKASTLLTFLLIEVIKGYDLIRSSLLTCCLYSRSWLRSR